MRYTTLLFDLDHTIFDSGTSAAAAFDDTLRSEGVADPSHYYRAFEEINVVLWAKVETGELTPNDVRHLRFRQLIDATDLDSNAVRMGDRYVRGLGNNGDLYPGAREAIDTLAGVATLALITNGIGEVQRSRIERLTIDHYFDAIAISGEVGHAKPGTRIFDIVFEELGNPAKDSALIVGDNLASDIQGGVNYGIATCWYNPERRDSGGVPVTHEIAHLAAIMPIANSG